MKILRQIASWASVGAVCAVSQSYGAGAGMLLAMVMALAIFGPCSRMALGAADWEESPNTGTSLATQSPDDVRKIWQAGVDVWEQNADFFSDFEGGQNSLIWEKTDTSKGKGMTMRFTNMSGFYDEPHMGEELFETSDDFEEILINGWNLIVDYIRHATRFTDRMEEVMGMRNEIQTGFNEELGKWLGRLKTEQVFMMCRESLPTANVLYGNGKTLDTLYGADSFAWDPIVMLATLMKGLGGMPAMTGKTVNGKPLWRQVVIAPTDALFSLELDPSYRQQLRETRDEQAANMLWSGGYTDVRGTVIKEYTPIDHDGEGAVGSPLNAKAFLGTAITAGTAVFDIFGGGNATSAAKTKKKYFKYFPNYAYRFRPDLTLSQDGATHYLLIINPPNAVTDPNKIGMYSYTTGNNGNKITIVNRLGSAAGTARVTTLGNVTWNTGVWLAGANGFAGMTDVHPLGALVLPCNANGQPFADILMFGRGAIVRGYGKYRNRRSQAYHEGTENDAFITDRFITSVFGQAPRQDRLGRVPGVTRMRVAYSPPGVPIPVITP